MAMERVYIETTIRGTHAMKDEIIEEVWKAKEEIASHANGDFRLLAAYIKTEAAKLKTAAVEPKHKKKSA
jgi:hypothetical protein